MLSRWCTGKRSLERMLHSTEPSCHITSAEVIVVTTSTATLQGRTSESGHTDFPEGRAATPTPAWGPGDLQLSIPGKKEEKESRSPPFPHPATSANGPVWESSSDCGPRGQAQGQCHCLTPKSLLPPQANPRHLRHLSWAPRALTGFADRVCTPHARAHECTCVRAPRPCSGAGRSAGRERAPSGCTCPPA